VTLSVRLVPRQPPKVRERYTLSGLTSGSYTINLNQRGLYLYYVSQNMTLSTANVRGVNFTVPRGSSTDDHHAPANQTVTAGQASELSGGGRTVR